MGYREEKGERERGVGRSRMLHVSKLISFSFCPVPQVLKLMVGDNLKDVQLQQIVDKTIIYADKDGDGMVSFEEFCNVRGFWCSFVWVSTSPIT
jgi:hypothetical protein